MPQNQKVDEVVIALMQRRQVRAVVRLLSRAMLHTPIHTAIFGERDEIARPAVEKMFAELFEQVPEISFVAETGGRIVALMRLRSCQGRTPPSRTTEDKPEGVAAKKHEWLSLWARHDPKDPHWHLGPIAVAPDLQNRGIGSLLMERFCREVDACRAPAYLETDLNANVDFYRKFGFQVIAEEKIFGVTNFFMWRPVKT